MSELSWPDTTQVAPPSHDGYLQAEWLLGRHPRLAPLLGRITGVVTQSEGGPNLHLDVLATVFAQVARYELACDEHRLAGADLSDAEALAGWENNAPRPADFVDAVPDGELPMSLGEAASLKLVALLSPMVRVPFNVGDLAGMDRLGKQVLADWCTLLPLG